MSDSAEKNSIGVEGSSCPLPRQMWAGKMASPGKILNIVTKLFINISDEYEHCFTVRKPKDESDGGSLRVDDFATGGRAPRPRSSANAPLPASTVDYTKVWPFCHVLSVKIAVDCI